MNEDEKCLKIAKKIVALEMTQYIASPGGSTPGGSYGPTSRQTAGRDVNEIANGLHCGFRPWRVQDTAECDADETADRLRYLLENDLLTSDERIIAERRLKNYDAITREYE